jgi:hypothetical protein
MEERGGRGGMEGGRERDIFHPASLFPRPCRPSLQRKRGAAWEMEAVTGGDLMYITVAGVVPL